MSGNRSDDERASVFAEVAARLDRVLAAACPELEASGVAVEDECERGIYSPHFFPGHHYRWRYRLVREGSVGGCMVRVAVALEYEEPFDVAPPPEVTSSVLAEVFLVGQQSFITWRDASTCSLAELERDGLEPMVILALKAGIAALPQPYRKAVDEAGFSTGGNPA